MNVATRVAVGDAAGTPIPGFVLNGNGTKPYTAQVSGVGNTTGVALVEIYEVP